MVERDSSEGFDKTNNMLYLIQLPTCLTSHYIENSSPRPMHETDFTEYGGVDGGRDR